jgi:hypothetical protein
MGIQAEGVVILLQEHAMNAPRELIKEVESNVSLPEGTEERFSGYGVMGLPFRSGHILAMRRFPVSSVGPGYTSIWHRTPAGEWEFFVNAPPRQSCPRYFGASAARAVETAITLEWLSPIRLHIAAPAVSFEWELAVGASPATRLMNAMGLLLPAGAWHNRTVLAMMGPAAGVLLGVGKVGLLGRVPNGQRFIANPRLLWTIVESRARLGREDFGLPGAVHPQACLGDFWIPQRGILAIGQTFFDPFDPARHSSVTSAESDSNAHARAA